MAAAIDSQEPNPVIKGKAYHDFVTEVRNMADYRYPIRSATYTVPPFNGCSFEDIGKIKALRKLEYKRSESLQRKIEAIPEDMGISRAALITLMNEAIEERPHIPPKGSMAYQEEAIWRAGYLQLHHAGVSYQTPNDWAIDVVDTVKAAKSHLTQVLHEKQLAEKRRTNQPEELNEEYIANKSKELNDVKIHVAYTALTILDRKAQRAGGNMSPHARAAQEVAKGLLGALGETIKSEIEASRPAADEVVKVRVKKLIQSCISAFGFDPTLAQAAERLQNSRDLPD